MKRNWDGMRVRVAGAAMLVNILLLPIAAVAQPPPDEIPCVSQTEIKDNQKKTTAFLEANTSQLKQSDIDQVRGMLDQVFEPMRQAASNHCKGTNREAVRQDVLKGFERLYSQVGVGGRMLFDNYEVPMYRGPWMGGQRLENQDAR